MKSVAIDCRTFRIPINFQNCTVVQIDTNLDWQSIHVWIVNKGYVIITQEQYDNLEVIDPNGAVP